LRLQNHALKKWSDSEGSNTTVKPGSRQRCSRKNGGEINMHPLWGCSFIHLEVSMGNEKEFNVLRVVDLKTIIDPIFLARIMTIQSSETAEICEDLLKKGSMVSSRKGLMLTPKGKECLKKEYQTRFGALRKDSKLLKAYQEFESLNEEFLSAMTKWQTVDIAGQSYPNEHSDAEYDSMVVSQLAEIVDNLKNLLTASLNNVPHLSLYAQRFEAAFKQIQMGNTSFIVDPKEDSLHNIWFEFHEDFLRVLGRGRR